MDPWPAASPGRSIDLGFTTGDVVVVSGAASGIGRATAVAAARVGLVVSAWDLPGTALDVTVAEIQDGGGSAHAVFGDVSNTDDVERGFAVARTHGPVRHLVNNAGPSSAVPLEFERALAICVGSMRLMTNTWLAEPVAGASVVNIASVAGAVIGTNSDWYCAAKSGIVGYTRHLATYRTDVVRANAVAPGMTNTPRMTGFVDSEVGQRILSRVPMGRMAEPDDLAWAILFLLSPLAAYVNGVLLPVDGGWTVAQ